MAKLAYVWWWNRVYVSSMYDSVWKNGYNKALDRFRDVPKLIVQAVSELVEMPDEGHIVKRQQFCEECGSSFYKPCIFHTLNKWYTQVCPTCWLYPGGSTLPTLNKKIQKAIETINCEGCPSLIKCLTMNV